MYTLDEMLLASLVKIFPTHHVKVSNNTVTIDDLAPLVWSFDLDTWSSEIGDFKSAREAAVATCTFFAGEMAELCI